MPFQDVVSEPIKVGHGERTWFECRETPRGTSLHPVALLHLRRGWGGGDTQRVWFEDNPFAPDRPAFQGQGLCGGCCKRVFKQSEWPLHCLLTYSLVTTAPSATIIKLVGTGMCICYEIRSRWHDNVEMFHLNWWRRLSLTARLYVDNTVNSEILGLFAGYTQQPTNNQTTLVVSKCILVMSWHFVITRFLPVHMPAVHRPMSAWQLLHLSCERRRASGLVPPLISRRLSLIQRFTGHTRPLTQYITAGFMLSKILININKCNHYSLINVAASVNQINNVIQKAHCNYMARDYNVSLSEYHFVT